MKLTNKQIIEKVSKLLDGWNRDTDGLDGFLFIGVGEDSKDMSSNLIFAGGNQKEVSRAVAGAIDRDSGLRKIFMVAALAHISRNAIHIDIPMFDNDEQETREPKEEFSRSKGETVKQFKDRLKSRLATETDPEVTDKLLDALGTRAKK